VKYSKDHLDQYLTTPREYNLTATEVKRVKRCVAFLKRIGEANSLSWQSICARPATALEFCESVELEARQRKARLIESLVDRDNPDKYNQ